MCLSSQIFFLSIKGIKKLFDCKTMHIEHRFGSQEEAINYASKSDTRVKDGLHLIYGIPKHQGISADYYSLTQSIKHGITLENIIEKFPKIYYHCHSAIDKAIALFAEKNAIEENYSLVNLTEWQTKLWRIIKEDIQNKNTRQIIWISDEHGNTGKTWFAKYLHAVHGAAYFRNARY